VENLELGIWNGEFGMGNGEWGILVEILADFFLLKSPIIV
jgi:hypothetical protein